MNCLQPVEGNKYRYSHIVGTGGIGSGMYFKLEGNHTIGRNESRLGVLVPFRDYCKLHIIFHYISVLLSGDRDGFLVYPLGSVGDDDIGRKLISEMGRVGMDTHNIAIFPGGNTLFSVCYQYPDKTGGNITTSNSASNQITAENIDEFFSSFNMNGKDEIILAVPEVPVSARLRLLEYGRKRGSYNMASVLSSEVDEFSKKGGFEKIDLLSINIDEAGAICGLKPETNTSPEIVESCVRTLRSENPDIKLVVTDGPHGSYGCNNDRIEYVPVCEVNVEGTAGAGDALLSGIASGMCCGLPFLKGENDTYFSQTPLKSALEFGSLLATVSVTSPDSIHMEINAKFLYDFMRGRNIELSSEYSKLFSTLEGGKVIKDEL